MKTGPASRARRNSEFDVARARKFGVDSGDNIIRKTLVRLGSTQESTRRTERGDKKQKCELTSRPVRALTSAFRS